ncbi:hypothetical protein FGO68_gene17755 [Halteria grandinella]|uniref:Uncharacterized protein n=1 Tax=Halteria grandinella TaxID=5974 RepID=A0A8J8SYH4_HALGN|nr:hypothetical protein FGO68_gene17755 [Halteria grandinella]
MKSFHFLLIALLSFLSLTVLAQPGAPSDIHAMKVEGCFSKCQEKTTKCVNAMRDDCKQEDQLCRKSCIMRTIGMPEL